MSQVDVGDDSHATIAASPPIVASQSPSNSPSYHQAGGAGSALNHIREHPTPQSIVSTGVAVIARRQTVADSDTTVGWTPNDIPDYTEVTPRQPIDEHSWQQRSMRRQSALLRFRYQVIPWIESNNCRSMFGPAIMSLARDSRIVSDCISACIRSRDKDLDLNTITSAGSTVPSRLLEQLAREDTFSADVGYALLSISSVFCTPPLEWATIASTCEARQAESVLSAGGFELTPEPLKSLLRLQLKVGKW